MDSENAIEVRNVCKSFGTRRSMSLKDRLVYHSEKKRDSGREVLKDISFNIKKGEAIGIIGRNGSGKSTMLKLLTKIIRPNGGIVETEGRVSCLIELGAGFHPDMSGRENIYINASIFGLDKDEVDRRMQSILDFSEIEAYIDERVRDYSSGMYMRLAFSIAINIDADILIVDEVLSVGDIAYQQKCLEKILELKKSGVTIVLVTQSPDQARFLCDRTIWLDNGNMKMIGDTKTVCRAYELFMFGGLEPMPSLDVGESEADSQDDSSEQLLQCSQLDDSAIKVVSFNLFDTLVVRPCVRPADLFKLVSMTGYLNYEFQLMREYADDLTFHELHAKELLDDIYRTMGTIFSVDPNVLDATRLHELDVECSCLRINAPVKSIYNLAITKGKRVIITLDTYFPADFIHKVLEKNGIRGYETVYISNEVGHRKDDGSMFDHILSEFGVRPSEVLHIGNDYRADCHMPREKGLRVMPIPAPADWLRDSDCGRHLKYVDSRMDNNILWGVYCNLFTRHNGLTADAFNSFRSLGLFFGPMILNLSQWLITRIRASRHGHLLISNDCGQLMTKVLELFGKHFDLGFTYEILDTCNNIRNPLYCDGGGLLRSIVESESIELMTVGDFIENKLFAQDDSTRELAMRLLSESGHVSDQSPIGPIRSLFPVFDELDRIYRNSVEGITASIRRYYENMLAKDDLAFFDVTGCDRVLAFFYDFFDKDLHGYQMVSQPNPHSDSIASGLENYASCSSMQIHDSEILMPFIEYIFSSPTPHSHGILMDSDESETAPIDSGDVDGVLMKIQEGILEYVEYALDLLGCRVFDLKLDRNHEVAVFADMLIAPGKGLRGIIRRIGSESRTAFEHGSALNRWCARFSDD